MLFDTHAHLDDAAFDADRHACIQNFHRNQIGLVMNPGCHFDSSKQAALLAQRYDGIYAAMGTHPDSAHEVHDDLIEKYRALYRANPKIKAIGEIGLDYHYETIPRAIQQQAFRMQLQLARELDLPVIVHEREAHDDGLQIIKEFPSVSGVFHCFSGSLELAKELIKRGWYIGFTGVLCFKNAKKAVEIAAQIPIERIVLETDCPYMAPPPYRGQRNEPAFLIQMASKLAEIRNISLQQAMESTFQNGKRLYRIEDPTTHNLNAALHASP